VLKHELLSVRRLERLRRASSAKKCKASSLMRSCLSFTYVVDALFIYIREEIDEETQEWERAQIKRSGLKPDEGTSIAATTPVYKPTPSTWSYCFGFRSPIFTQNSSSSSDRYAQLGVLGHASFPNYDFYGRFSCAEHYFCIRSVCGADPA
jgi:hypothetical protein